LVRAGCFNVRDREGILCGVYGTKDIMDSPNPVNQIKYKNMFILMNEPKELAAYLHQQRHRSDETIVSKPGDNKNV
jgi:hypothetical protein